MNKHLIVVGIAVLLLAVGLSGCTSEFGKKTIATLGPKNRIFLFYEMFK